MKLIRLPLLLSCALAFFLLSSCSKKDEGSAESGNPSAVLASKPFHDLRDLPGTVFDVAYTPETVRIDESSWKSTLKSVSSDGTVFVFDNPDSKITSLAAGQVLFLENLSVRKVVATATHDGHFAVKTERAGITDLIQKGQIKWNVPVKFSSLYAAAPAPASSSSGQVSAMLTRISPEGVVYASGTEIHFSGKMDDWKYTIGVVPSPNRLDMNFSVAKTIDTLGVSFAAKGFLKDFVSTADMHIQDGATDSFNFSNTGMNGEMNVDYAAVRGGGDTAGMDKPNIKLPTLAKIPFPIAGIPFVVSVNANLILKPGFGGKKETIKGTFKVSYNGDEGVQVTNGEASVSGAASGDGTIGDFLSTSIAPHAILLGMAAPKITLSLGTDSTVDMLTSALPSSLADALSDIFSRTDPGKWAKKKMETTFKTEASANVQNVAILTIATSGAVSLVPCRLSRLTLEYKAGADAYMLGRKAADKEIVLFKKDFVLRVPDINACGEK
jgi:hypothetical protein